MREEQEQGQHQGAAGEAHYEKIRLALAKEPSDAVRRGDVKKQDDDSGF